jgi:hypothetical protein
MRFWGNEGELIEIIPITTIQVNRQFCYLIPLLKAEHGKKLLDGYAKRILRTVVDSPELK